jgi:AraC-like DNA-binding protein
VELLHTSQTTGEPPVIETEQLRGLLQSCEHDFPDVYRAARSLGMSSRTLSRRLSRAGTSYSEILNAVRMAKAAELMRGGWPIHAIGMQVGYSDASNFRRAFKRWTGQTPEAFRRSLLDA